MKFGIVTLRVRSGDGKLPPRGSTLKRSSSSGVVPSASQQSCQADRDRGSEETTAATAAVTGRFEVTLVKESGRPLGLQLTDVKGREEGALQGRPAVAIRNIAPNSPAKRCGNLM